MGWAVSPDSYQRRMDAFMRMYLRWPPDFRRAYDKAAAELATEREATEGFFFEPEGEHLAGADGHRGTNVGEAEGGRHE